VIVHTVPTFGWEGVLFTCRHCGAVVSFTKDDLRSKSFRARETLTGGWAVRAHCAVCGNALAQFRPQEAPDADPA
jgi:hypothetical protein